ncbi:MAG: hypothetical protein J6M39_07335 [Lachnospiraceae bacterium]|nr:hypothetical protein [Lachnospiraceae bacterium]
MIVGFKGDESKLKKLYKELGLKEIKVNTFEEIEDALKSNDGNVVLTNYNEVMVFEKPTADLIEKRNSVLKLVLASRKNVYLSLTKSDPSLDKIALDYHVCTSINTKDIKQIEDIFSFLNTDLPYSGKLADDKYAVRAHNENRATEKSINELKKLIR